jgi:hypothetical protein
MIIEKEIKEPMKKQRLEVLKRRYFELELDVVALKATGDTEGVEITIKRMQAVQAAYEAVEAIPVE